MEQDFKKQELIKKLSDRKWRLNNIYYIADEFWNTIHFKQNTIQIRIDEESSWYRDLILKYRQWWVSTKKIIDLLDDCLFWWINRNNVFITHRQDLLDEFFKKAKFIYDYIPTEVKAILPEPKIDNANELYFPRTRSGKPLHNTLKISLNVRWKTPTNLHVSEFAFMDLDRQREIKQQMDQFRQTKITIETTANGIWDIFYNMCMTAKQWRWTYKLLFFPWYIEERNIAKLPKDFCLTDEEKRLKENYPQIRNEQIFWRRLKIEDANSLGYNWIEKFHEENPITIDSAFISSWASVFDLSAPYTIVRPYKEYEWWNLFKEPQDDLIFWVDIAEWWNTWDFSAIVWYNRMWELVCSYKWRINEELLSEKLNLLLEYEENQKKYLGRIVPENNIWRLFIKECQKYHWNWRIHHEIRPEITVQESRDSNKFWFRTTKTSKDFIIRLFRWAIHRQEIEVSEEIKSEIDTYQYDSNNRPNAIAPNHDDMLMASMIAYFWVTKIYGTIEYEKPVKTYWSKAEDIAQKDINQIILNTNNLQTSEDLYNEYYEYEEF